MAVPILNMKISDIVSALGEATSNITLRNLHLSPKVIGSGLDPDYCSGANGYERLANLRDTANVGGLRSFYIGKFRNYDPVSINYKQGHFYTYKAFEYWDVFTSPAGYSNNCVHIPDGWRIMTVNDFYNIITAIEPSSDYANNTVAKHLKSIYKTDDTPFDPSPGWSGFKTNFDTYGFKQMASGICLQGENNDVLTLYNVGLISYSWLHYQYQTNENVIITFSDNSDKVGTLSQAIELHLAQIRLIKNDSVNPGYVEDIEGNIYPTIKIGDNVITAEGIRTTKNKSGNSLTEMFLDDIHNFSNLFGYFDIKNTDIP